MERVLGSKENHRGVLIGRVAAREAEAVLHASGVAISGKKLAFDSSYLRHAFKSHGLGGELRRGQRAITHADLAQALEIFRASRFQRGTERADVRFKALATSGGDTFHTVWEARRNSVVLISMWVGK